MNIKLPDEMLATLKAFLKQYWYSENIDEYIEQLAKDDLRKNLAPGYDHDTLTGCKNKFYIRRDFENAISHSKNTDFHTKYVCLDIEHFKDYLDYHGLRAGDQKLIDVAKQIESNYPKNNIYRYGGDEFVLELVNEEFTPVYIPEISLKYSVVDIVVKGSNYQKSNFEREIYYYLETGFFESSTKGAFISHFYESPKAG